MHGLILEGIPGVGKSRVLAAMRRSEAFSEQLSILTLSEHYTERAIEHRQDRSPRQYEFLLYRLLSALEPLRVLTVESPVLAGKNTARLRYVFERFHLTAAVCHAGDDERLQERVERALGLYRPKLVLCVCDEGEIEARLRDTLPRRTPCWEQFLFRHGHDWAEVAAYYAEQQRHYQLLAERSSLDTLVIDTSREGYDSPGELLAAGLAAD